MLGGKNEGMVRKNKYSIPAPLTPSTATRIMQPCPENLQVTETTDTSHMHKRRNNGNEKELQRSLQLAIQDLEQVLGVAILVVVIELL